MRRIISCLAVIVASVCLATGTMLRPPVAECPTMTIECDEGMVCPYEPITFTAAINGGDSSLQLTFKWTVSAGTIISGQGTPAITVDTTGLINQKITATLELAGLTALTAGCSNSVSCTRQIALCCIYNRKFDEYGDISFKKEKERLDNFAIQLENEPGAQGVIIVYGGLRARRGDAEARANRAKDYMVNKHGIEAERIVTVPGGNVEGSSVELWIGVSGNKYLPTASRTDAVEPRER